MNSKVVLFGVGGILTGAFVNDLPPSSVVDFIFIGSAVIFIIGLFLPGGQV